MTQRTFLNDAMNPQGLIFHLYPSFKTTWFLYIYLYI